VFDASASPTARANALTTDQAALPPGSISAEQADVVAAEPAVEMRVPVFNLDELRKLAVRQALEHTDGHRGQAAALLGVSLNTMTRLVAEACPEIQAKSGRKRASTPQQPR